MRTALVIALVAGLVVLLSWIGDYGTASSPGTLPPSANLAGETGSGPPAPRAAQDLTAAAALPGAPGGVVAATPAGFSGRCQAAGEVGAAILRILERTHGQDIRTIDRNFAFDYHKILVAWAADPARKEADVQLLLEAWSTVPDGTFRWALSWLFEKSGDERFIEPLKQLAGIDPWRMTDALANLGYPRAIDTLVDMIPAIEKPEVRSQARIRLARSGRDGATGYLVRAAADATLTYAERMVAVEVLGLVDNDPSAVDAAMKIALGPAAPVGDLGERNEDHPERDLRSAAVLAVMKRGDQDRVRQLLDVADAPGADRALARIVDLQIGGYLGADLSQVLFARIDRRRKVSLGEARYLNNVCTRSDLVRLKGLIALGETQEVRDLLHAAALNAATRE